ncbi:FAD-binding domain-containing protein [Tabrizicola fusiformis]|uniref:FAD-binding domain-containing protein n=1 Tax=Tabrizicola sp. SY72 TaxID=2741673 RepID=UPI0015734819|nr:FAD-binding domain-containing protein [Tabrizicola sp. SY72]NTT85386.1 deoxyribodipyrimidine photo-lyase [Tabrizicola sp. SY72]
MNVLVWLKRDLRLADHPALTLAAGMGRALPVYVVEPEYWQLPDTSARQWEVTAEALADLREALAAVGMPLVLRVGPAVEVLARLCRQHDITTIVSHEETGNLWTFARDRQVGAWARGAGIVWHEVPQSGVVRRLGNRDGWQARRDAFTAEAVLPAPAMVPVPGVERGQIPTARALRLAEDRCPHRQRGGRTEALLLLDSFLTQRGEPYRSAMSAPLAAERACSRLSPHLALGSLSGREAVQATTARAAERPGGRWGGALSSFQSRLAWRDHFMQKLEDQPDIELRCLSRAAEALRPREADATRLAAWATGQTGLPFVDACMRYLQATGWLNFRMRAMLMAVASYHLWLDWRATGHVLARAFTDYEPGIHWPQVQMQSGVTAINTPRIYNPVKQGLEQDPTGAFTRRWLPELAAVPDGFLQEPWKWPGFAKIAGRRYPEPLVDPVAAARAARDAVWELRRREGHRDEAAAIAARHASRAPARSPRRMTARPASAQLALDL